jgi:MoxR-like ATPase
MEDIEKKMDSLEEVAGFIRKYIVGMDDLIKLLLIAILTEGHILIEGPPGTGKTLTARLLALSIGGIFRRVQMTPDILPTDILGSYYYNLQKGEWILREGPIFSNILLVDEISRAPPRTQSALLEAMGEGRVSLEGRTFDLPKPFLVIATQINLGDLAGEGVYPLTPTLTDRFAYSYITKIVDKQHEMEILKRIDNIDDVLRSQASSSIISTKDLLVLQRRVRDIYVDDRIRKYIVDLIDALRRSEDLSIPPSTRASIWLLKGSRAIALLERLNYVVPDHVKEIAPYVLYHRIYFRDPMKEVDKAKFIKDLLTRVEVPKI